MVWDNLLVNIQVCIGGIAGSIGGGISVGIGGVLVVELVLVLLVWV